jgi:spore coat polysaccharide biosynthesis protein SpsF
VRVGGLVPVRLGSERLPGKALAQICGKPVIGLLIERMASTRALEVENIVVCTTSDGADDALVPAVEAAGASVYRGSRDDLVERFHGAVHEFGFDAVIQVDGDDPCADPGYMDMALERLLADDEPDVVLCHGLPLGIASKAIRTSAIDHVHDSYVPGDNATGFSLYFSDRELCTLAVVEPVSDKHRHDRARLTLDYPEDLEFFRAIFGELYDDGRAFGVEEIVALLGRRPELLAINQGFEDVYEQRTAEQVAAAVVRYRTATGEIREIEY